MCIRDRSKVKMQLKSRMEDESPEARQERLLNEQFEKEEWLTLRPHLINSPESDGILQTALQGGESMEECGAGEKRSVGEYVSLLTAEINKDAELPYAVPESKPFLTQLQRSAGSLSAAVGELFSKQQVLPFTFLEEFFKKASRESLVETLKGLAVHVCRGIFALNADRLYRTERNQKTLRNARNEVLRVLRQLGSWQYISREDIDKYVRYPREVVNKILEDIGESDKDKWRLKFSEFGIENFEEVVSIDSLVSDATDIAVEKPPQSIYDSENKEDSSYIENIIHEEIKREGIMTYMQLLNHAKQKVSSKLYSQLEAIIDTVIAAHTTTINNVLIYSRSSEESLQEVVCGES
eukprot:TRINITY_DN2092_c0_g7_i1.p1 TRINITY_DN2092_c0_g7~~TRINITY_DN2092_c0_g7_i1.p1  ORF type:complete len:352 (-),score=99.36 TRINITY_DN2092_c0_g7_i1:198-1253(-)